MNECIQSAFDCCSLSLFVLFLANVVIACAIVNFVLYSIVWYDKWDPVCYKNAEFCPLESQGEIKYGIPERTCSWN